MADPTDATHTACDQRITDDGQRIAELEADVERLSGWKREAIMVLDQWEKVHDALDQPGRLGESKALASAREVERLREALALASMDAWDCRDGAVEHYLAMADELASYRAEGEPT